MARQVNAPGVELPYLETRWDELAGQRIFSRLCVSADTHHPPVVLVHGLSMSSRYMIPTARRLARDHSVYAPDLPGYGESPHPAHTLTVDELAEVLRAWMDHLGIGPAVLLANSLGCQTTVHFALHNPGRVLAAVLVGPTMDPSGIHLPKLFSRAVRNMLHEPIDFYPVLARDYMAAGVRETFQALEAAIRDPIEDKLRRMAAPTLVVRGQYDKLVTQAWAKRVTHLLPDGRLVVIPGAAHVVNYDAAGQLVPLVKAFMADHHL